MSSRIRSLEKEMIRALCSLRYPGTESKDLPEKNLDDLRARVHEFLVLTQVVQGFTYQSSQHPDRTDKAEDFPEEGVV